MKPTIEITLHDDGSITADAQNFKGPNCKKALAVIDDLMRDKTTKIKPEYYQSATVMVRQKTR